MVYADVLVSAGTPASMCSYLLSFLPDLSSAELAPIRLQLGEAIYALCSQNAATFVPLLPSLIAMVDGIDRQVRSTFVDAVVCVLAKAPPAQLSELLEKLAAPIMQRLLRQAPQLGAPGSNKALQEQVEADMLVLAAVLQLDLEHPPTPHPLLPIVTALWPTVRPVFCAYASVDTMIHVRGFIHPVRQALTQS